MLRTTKSNDKCKRSLRLLENIFTVYYVICFLSMIVRRHYVNFVDGSTSRGRAMGENARAQPDGETSDRHEDAS